MNSEIIEIIDTAVKIGLGATIGGLFSYLISFTNHKNDLYKQKFENKVKLLKEISESFHKTQLGTNRYISLVSIAINHGEEDLKELEIKCKESLDGSFEEIGKAYSIANMIGLKKLHDDLREYSLAISELDDATNSFRNGIPNDACFIDPIQDRAYELAKEIYIEISKAYQKFNS